MSDYIESLFQGVDMLIDKKLENLNYDTTIICTITDNSDSKNGKYRVTDGSIAFTAYSDVSTYRSGEQVRVNVPQGDMTKKKFIIGKYLSDDNNSALTYVSPLNSVINITGNLFDDLSGQWSILANGPNTAVDLWEDDLNPKQYGDLQANGIYNTLIIKAEFKTDLYNYNYINGTYGLRVELDVRPTPDSTAKYTKVVELSSKEMFGNPYNFTIFAPQAKVFNVVSAGVIEKIKLFLYQNNDFVNDREERIVPMGETPDNIFVKNIEIGLGSNVLDVEDNTVRIYSKESTNYSPEDYTRSLNLVWYNKDENNQSIGFEDQQINDKLYNEFDYLQLVNLDQRLLNQQGKKNVNNDKTSLTLAANAEQIEDILEKVADKISYDINSEFNKIMDYSLPDETITILQNKKDTLTNLAMDLFFEEPEEQEEQEKHICLNSLWQTQYEMILSSIYNLQRYNQNPADFDNKKPSLISVVVDFYETSFLNLNSSQQEYKDYSIKTLYDGYLIKITNDITIPEGYTEIFNIFNHQISKILKSIKKLLDEIPDDCDLIRSFLETIKANDTQILAAYKQTDLSMYDNQYDIYWYRYEEKYEAPDTEYKLMPNGWKIYETQGKTTLADKCFISGIELDPTLDQEKFVALVIYNHEIYKSNELVFNNTNPLPTQKETDATDTLRIEHIANSFNTYYVYDSTNNLKDALDADRDREMRCHYDGLRYKDDILIGATIHWYIPTDATMLTYDEAFLKGKGFSCPDKQTKPGYIEFYKTINQILKSTLREDQWDSWGNEETEDGEKKGKGFALVGKGKEEEDDGVVDKNVYDDRSFWYKIKPQLDTGLTNNDIICRVVLAADTKEVETKEFFFFGLTGNTGTKYTFNIYNDNKKKAFVTSDKDNDPLKLSIELRDPTYKIIDFATSPSVNWLGYKKIGNTSSDFKPPEHAKVSGNNITLSEEPISGIIIGETNIDYFHPLKKDSETEEFELNTGEDATLDNTKNPLPVALSCLYPVPYSISEDYVLAGPINIIYDNFGVLNSKMNYDTHYQLKNKNDDTLVTSHEGKPIWWDINYGIVDVTIDDNNRVIPKKNEEITTQPIPENNENKDVYGSYAPILTKDRRLQPSPIYLSDLYMIPFVEAYIMDDSDQKIIIYSQPIIIKQDKYPSEFLNEWNGGYYVDDKAGLIMSSMVGAGRKNLTKNTFDGILMGEVAKQADMPIMKDNLGEGTHSGLGLYGFHDGEQSFGFNIDGSAFIGKSGGGRIVFDGNKGFIASANWFGSGGKITWDSGQSKYITTPSNAGMCINLQDGHIDAYNFKLTSNNIQLNASPNEDEDFFKIGNDTDGYLQFSKGGALEIAVKNFSLLGPAALKGDGNNLLKQTKPIKKDGSWQVNAWQSTSSAIFATGNEEAIGGKSEALSFILRPANLNAIGFANSIGQSLSSVIKHNTVYTLSGHIRVENDEDEDEVIFGFANSLGALLNVPIKNEQIRFENSINNDHIVFSDDGYYSFKDLSNNVWYRFEITFSVVVDNIDYIFFGIKQDSATTLTPTKKIHFWQLQLEEGFEATTWGRHPDEIGDYINSQVTIPSMTMSKTEIFDTLFWTGKYSATDPTKKEYQQGAKLENGNFYISAEVIQTGILKSADYDGRVDETSGKIEQAPNKGLCINLNTGTFSTPHFAIQQHFNTSTQKTTVSGIVGGWSILKNALIYDNNQTSEQTTYIGSYWADDDLTLNPDLATVQKGVYNAQGEIIEEDSDYLYYSFRCMHEPESFFRYYYNKAKYNGQSNNGLPGILIFLYLTDTIEEGDPLYDYRTLFNPSTGLLYAPYLTSGNIISFGDSASDFVDALINTRYTVLLYFQSRIRLEKTDYSASIVDKWTQEEWKQELGSSYDLYQLKLYMDNTYTFQSFLGNDPSEDEDFLYGTDSLFYLGKTQIDSQDAYRFNFQRNGTLTFGGVLFNQGHWKFSNDAQNGSGKMEFFQSPTSTVPTLRVGAYTTMGTDIHPEAYISANQYLILKIIKNDTENDIVTIADNNGIITTQGTVARYSGFKHIRQGAGATKLGVRGGGGVSLEWTSSADQRDPDVRLDVYQLATTNKENQGATNADLYTIGLKASQTDQGSWVPLKFDTYKCYYGGTFTSKVVNLNSTEKIKENIKNISFSLKALDLFDKNRSQIYSYNLKKSLTQSLDDEKTVMKSKAYNLSQDSQIDSVTSYGFVIGDGYVTPKEVLSESGDAINLYSMASLNWKATQELYELYQDLSSKIDDLKNINGEKGEINNEINQQ